MNILAMICFIAANTNAFVLKPGIPPKSLFLTGSNFFENYNFNIIYPGTKWCGNGDIADNYDDLGVFMQTDMCCRTHDHCDDYIVAGESNHGLVNPSYFTRLHCKCDLAFYNCLLDSDESAAGDVAITYFNILGQMCFDLKPPATCSQYSGFFSPHCIEYEHDNLKPEEWQWFDVPRWF